MDITSFNKKAWDKLVTDKNQWTLPVTSEQVDNARRDDWSVLLTPTKSVPKNWFPPMKNLKVLALGSGGGQQGPLFAAAGAEVTVFDNSPRQLEQDKMVATRDSLVLKTVEGDMKDLSVFADGSFDFIFHPCSNLFVPDVNPVWREAFRVLKKGGSMLAGLSNPIAYAIDTELEKQGIVQIKYKIPYSDLTSLTEEERLKLFGPDEAIHHGHTLQDLIGGQIDAGFVLTGFYEDSWKGTTAIHEYIDCFIATKALKP